MDVVWSGSETPSLSDEDTETEQLLNSESLLNLKFLMIKAYYWIMAKICISFLHVVIQDVGVLIIMLFCENESDIIHESSWTFFGYVLVKQSFLKDELARKPIFIAARQSMFFIMNTASNKERTPFLLDQVKQYREEICRLLVLCYNFIRQGLGGNEFRKDLVHELFCLCKAVGKLSQLPTSYWETLNTKDDVYFHLCHINYELRLFLFLCSYHVLKRDAPEVNFGSVCGEIFMTTLWDLVGMANILFSQANKHGKIWTAACTPCSCVKEIWIALIHIMDNAAKKFSMLSFWSAIYQICDLLDNEIERKKMIPREVPFNMSVDFKMWLITKLAVFYWIDVSGFNTFTEKLVVPGNWLTVNELLQTSLKKPFLEEECVKNLLWGCVILTNHWSINMDGFTLFLDYFNKTLNNQNKRENTQRITSFVQQPVSIAKKVEQVISGFENVSSFPSGKTSFQIFLHFLATTMKRIDVTNEEQYFNQMKGRIYSKFHRHRITELNSCGLEKLALIFISISISKSSADILQKLSQLLSTLKFDQMSRCLQKGLISCQFTALFACLHGKFHTEQNLKSIMSLHIELVKLYNLKKRSKDELECLWNLICYFLECVEESWEYAELDISFLVTKTYVHLIKISTHYQRQRIYTHLKCLLSSVLIQKNLEKSFNVLWNEIVQPLESLSMNDPSNALTEFLAGVALLALDSGSSSSFLKMFQMYGLNGKNTIQCCIFITWTLSSSLVVEFITEKAELLNELIRVWINCVLEHLYASTYVVDLTKSMLTMQNIGMFVTTKQCNVPDDVQTIIIDFITGFSAVFLSLQSIFEISEWRTKISFYFSGLVTLSEAAMAAAGRSTKSLQLLFLVAGTLACSCAKSIYSKTSPSCLLPKLLDTFLLPMNSSKKQVPEAVVKQMKSHLHLFLHGLSRLDFKRDEFIVRKIKEIHHKYFLDSCIRFYLQETNNDAFMVPLKGSCVEKPEKISSDYRELVLVYIKEVFLNLPQPPQTLAAVLSFLLRLLQRTLSVNEMWKSSKILLCKVLSCLLVCDAVRGNGEPPDIRKLSMMILKCLFTIQEPHSQEIKELLLTFLKENVCHYKEVVLKTFHSVCIITSSRLRDDLLPDVEALVSANQIQINPNSYSKMMITLEEIKTLNSAKRIKSKKY